MSEKDITYHLVAMDGSIDPYLEALARAQLLWQVRTQFSRVVWRLFNTFETHQSLSRNAAHYLVALYISSPAASGGDDYNVIDDIQLVDYPLMPRGPGIQTVLDKPEEPMWPKDGTNH